MRSMVKILAAATGALLAIALSAGVALAHEQRAVGQYALEVGFLAEPAVEGQPNAFELTVHKNLPTSTPPVAGLEKTLQVEVTHVASNTSKTFPFQAVDPDGDPGRYVAAMIPTATGQYKFRVFGTIEGTQVNETFTSGPNTFSDVVAAAGLQVPTTIASGRELQGVAQAAQTAAAKAQDAARTAQDTGNSAKTLAVVGIVLGALGIVVGVAGVISARRR